MAKTKTAPETVTTSETTTENKTYKKRFLVADVGTKGATPFAFHVEGGLVRIPNMLPAKEDKEPMLVTSLAIGMGCWAMLARAKGEDKPEDEGAPFIGITLHGKLAEKFSKDATVKGMKFAVSGELKTYMGKNKDGVEEKRVEIDVINYVIASGPDAKRTMRIAAAPRTYTAKNGTVQSDSNALLLTGKICNIQPLTASAKSGKPFLRAGFSMVVPAKKVFDLVNTNKAGEYAEDEKKIMNIVFFGPSAETKAKFLKNGMTVAITGRVGEDTYEGKTNYTAYPTTLTVVSWPEEEAKVDDGEEHPADKQAAVTQAAAATNEAFAELTDEDDDELPF